MFQNKVQNIPNEQCYKNCFVPKCKSTTIATPNKIFIHVPTELEKRKLWFKIVGRSGENLKRSTYCCEDHFDLKEDLKFFHTFELIGGRKSLKKGVLPRFNLHNECENDGETYHPKLTSKTDIGLQRAEETLTDNSHSLLNNRNLAEATKTTKVTDTNQAKPKLIRVLQSPKSTTASNLAINPVPLANLLKVALSSGAKKIKVTHSSNQKLVAVPMSMMPKAVASSSITFVKPSTHFLVPKEVAKSMQKVMLQKKQGEQQPSVIDLDSDEETTVLENNEKTVEVVDNDEIEEIDSVCKDYAVPDSPEVIESNGDDDLMVISENESSGRTTRTSSRKSPTLDGTIPLKLRQRDQRFKKMLVLQSQEIDNTLVELKTKVLKLVQMSNNKPGHEEDLLNSAALCTKRFHRAMRKALVELSIINDRLVKDYVHWKKRAVGNTNLKKKSRSKDDIPLEMVCVRDSASESEMDDEDEDIEATFNEDRVIEATDIPPDFSAILDHLTIFKRKLTSVKGVGDNSVDVEDKACQADDVPWRDYEKCIGYSLLTRAEFDEKTQEKVTRPVVIQDENFGKYQEQFMFYLQHIEDHGIETDEMKGLPDPNHIPLKDLIDGTSPFITDMLERLSPVTLSNGCTSPTTKHIEEPETESHKLTASLPEPMDTSPSPDIIEQNAKSSTTTTREDETDGKTAEKTVPTSKAVEELVKMVTKLSEDLRTEQTNETDVSQGKVDSINDETISICENSILENACTNFENSIVETEISIVQNKDNKRNENEERKMDDEVASLTVEEDCTTLD